MDDEDEETLEMVGACLGLSTERIREPFKNLTEREKNVLRLRFGIDSVKGHTLGKVGEIFEVTRERIRQIEAKALRKLRSPNRSKLLKSFYES